MLISVLTVVAPGVMAFLGVLATQLFMRRKTGAEAHKTEAEAVSIEVDTRLKLDNIAANIKALQDAVKDIDSRAKRVEHQVANTHLTNLRDDIDTVKATQDAQSEQLAKHGEVLNSLSDNLRKIMCWTKTTIEGK